MHSFVCGLADQAYREERIRLFHCAGRAEIKAVGAQTHSPA